MDESMNSKGVSRRGFLKGSALAALGTAAFATSIGMVGCAPAKEGKGTGDSLDANALESGFEVYDADVIVVGAGVSGSQAALRSFEEGASVIVIDKGPFQYSGVGGMNFDIMLQTEPESEKPAFATCPPLSSSKLYENSMPYNEWDVCSKYVNQGVSTIRRNADGSVFNRLPSEDNSTMHTDFGFMRHVTDVIRDKGILVYDQTMVTDIIVQKGICKGVIGLHLPTGTFRVFRSKAVIKSTGGCTQMYGWKTVSACTTQGGDNTADTDIAALRHGCELIGCEFFRWDTVVSKPDGIAFGYNAVFTCDTVNKNDITDIDGEHFLSDVADRTEFFQTAAAAVAAGKTNENGGFYADMTADAVAVMRPAYKRNVELWKKIFDIDIEGAKLDIELQCYEHGGSPRVDDTMMVLGIEGLFDVRGGEALGTNGGMAGGTTYRQARYAAVCGCRYAQAVDAGKTDDFDWGLVTGEFDRLHEIRMRTVDGGLRPHEVRHAIQRASYTGIGPAGNAEKYEACIQELERIIKEDLPRQVVTNKTMVYNNEWKQAIENYNVAYIALATAKAMLMREETRAQFLRTDFPESDEEFWGKNNVGIKLDGDALVVEAVPVA